MFVCNGKLQEISNPNMMNPNHNRGMCNPNTSRKIRFKPPQPPQSVLHPSPQPIILTPSGKPIHPQKNYLNQIYFLLLMQHAKGCSARPCRYRYCMDMKMLFEHMKTCNSPPPCTYGYKCMQAKKLIDHRKSCCSQQCPVCGHVDKYLASKGSSTMVVQSSSSVRTSENVPLKRLKVDHIVIERNEPELSLMKEVKSEVIKKEGDSIMREEKKKFPNVSWVSLIEIFTVEQIEAHISSLGKRKRRSKLNAMKTEVMKSDANSCSLCDAERLAFDPLPIYCTPCGGRIKKYKKYYTTKNQIGSKHHYVCLTCYNARGTMTIGGVSIQKTTALEEKVHDITSDELWVQCDKCQDWQHQICALFNARRNAGGKAPYICPECCIEEIENGKRVPLQSTYVLGVKDLPITKLSNHIEKRLLERCEQERQERANLLGKNIKDVPGVEPLVVRVVSSVDKKLEVKQNFRELFPDGYPSEFPYKSKVILLFQNIDGVEVCLFGMFVQEYGSECKAPNHRRIYISYLDSIKYFRPEIKTVSGEALRTFVYHEILIGYLDYCKMRGFTSCYIWACPPLKDDDYIMYCHPEMQKIPKPGKLREWYLSMLEKARRENIVVDITNLHDYLIHPPKECKAARTTARLPYLDGDYLPGAFEDMIGKLGQDDNGKKSQKHGKKEKSINMRALKDFGHTDFSKKPSKDLLLLRKLSETISPMKHDFILVHLQHSCTQCSHLMISGNRWVCNKCKNFQLCDTCHGVDKHQHKLFPIEVRNVPADTKDEDEIMGNEFFDNRHAFLGLCETNRYQYDTLRRAKHSSMMVLYHLHNPTAPAFVPTCRVCNNDIEIGQGWRCETCQDYEECNECFGKEGGSAHPHTLTRHKVDVAPNARRYEQKLRAMHDLLVHCQLCSTRTMCSFRNCIEVKKLFYHSSHCKTHARGGCEPCKKTWCLLSMHVRICKETECRVPRCKDLKAHYRNLAKQFDSRRRAATTEMMRKRAAEIKMNIE